MTNPRFEQLFDGPPRAPESRISPKVIFRSRRMAALKRGGEGDGTLL